MKHKNYIQIEDTNDIYSECAPFYLSIKSEHVSSKVGFVADNDNLKKLAEKMQNYFPAGNDEIIFQSKDCNQEISGFFYLRIFKQDSLGQLGVEIKTRDQSLHTFISKSCHFYIPIEVSDVNKLGLELEKWLNETSEKFCYFWSENFI